MSKLKNFSELSQLHSFEERYFYLRLNAKIGESTFGHNRFLNQMLYHSREWKRVRDLVIIRDNGCDLGMDGYQLNHGLLVHHMNPITVEDVENNSPKVYDPEFLICVSHMTHEAIHFGDESLLPQAPVARTSGDTILWKHI